MYLDYWNLKEPPFENTPDPRFLYASKQHREALSKLFSALSEEKGCALLTGEYGCGKTHLIRTVVQNLDASHYEVALIDYPIFQGKSFWKRFFASLGRKMRYPVEMITFRSSYVFSIETWPAKREIFSSSTRHRLSMTLRYSRSCAHCCICNWKIALC